VKYNIT